ncbi:MAG: amidohydrolase, partial [Candidatus Zixiibacteriota bacterium]
RLHQHPELSFKEFQTTRLIKSELKRHRIKVAPVKIDTGAVGIINGDTAPAVALRTDIDALPITEATGLPFRSVNDGVMHACGHDIHMATVMGTAVILSKLRRQLPVCIKVIFQPAEESPPGGAERMIKEGVLDDPDVRMIFGLHVDPTLRAGKISLRDGPTMASVTDFDITILGRGGHAAVPHRSVDAIAVAAEIIESMQKIVSRETNPLKPALVTFGTVRGGTIRNVIADKVHLSGTARTLDPRNLKLLPRLMKRTVEGVCRARGADFRLDILSGYPVLNNHEKANKILRGCFTELFGGRLIEETPQTMGGEDFSFYLNKVPGAMFRLGVKNEKIKANKPWHSPEFIADERSIYYGTALLTYAVLKFAESV